MRLRESTLGSAPERGFRVISLDLHVDEAVASGLGAELVYGALRHDAASADDQQPAAGLLHLLKDVGAEKDGPLAAHRPYQLANRHPLVWVKALGRLIHDQDLGAMQDGLGKADSLFKPLGALAYGAIVYLAYLRLLHRLLYVVSALRGRESLSARPRT